MQTIFQAAFFLLYFGMGIVQFKATFDGLEYLLGWNSFILGFISIILSYTPLLGSICGVLGAHKMWGWDILPAMFLFFWFAPLALAYAMAGAVASGLNSLSFFRQKNISQEIEEGQQPASRKTSDRKNIFLRVMAGELSLPVTFWCFGIAAPAVINFSLTALFSKNMLPFLSNIVSIYGFTAFKVTMLALQSAVLFYVLAIAVGVWLSAANYTGHKVWSFLAKLIAVLWLINLPAHVGVIIDTAKLDKTNQAQSIPSGTIDFYKRSVDSLLN